MISGMGYGFGGIPMSNEKEIERAKRISKLEALRPGDAETVATAPPESALEEPVAPMVQVSKPAKKAQKVTKNSKRKAR